MWWCHEFKAGFEREWAWLVGRLIIGKSSKPPDEWVVCACKLTRYSTFLSWACLLRCSFWPVTTKNNIPASTPNSRCCAKLVHQAVHTTHCFLFSQNRTATKISSSRWEQTSGQQVWHHAARAWASRRQISDKSSITRPKSSASGRQMEDKQQTNGTQMRGQVGVNKWETRHQQVWDRWETSGRQRKWETDGRQDGDKWETSAKQVGNNWETSLASCSPGISKWETSGLFPKHFAALQALVRRETCRTYKPPKGKCLFLGAWK